MNKLKYLILLNITLLMFFSHQNTTPAGAKSSSFEEYQFEHLDIAKTTAELNNMTTQFGFIRADLINERVTILQTKGTAREKKHRLFNSTIDARSKCGLGLWGFAMQPFSDHKSISQTQGKHKAYPQLYRAWFKALEAQSQTQLEIFENFYAIDESANANRALTEALEAGNERNIVVLSKQARLYLKINNKNAALQLLQQIEQRKKTEQPHTLYLPNYATFIWASSELQTQIQLAQQAYQQEVALLRKRGLL